MNKYFKRTVAVFIFFTGSNFAVAQNPFSKKIIEFGWDYPKVSNLFQNIRGMENAAPFDGVVFSFDFNIYNAFDTTFFADSLFQFDLLPGIKWKKFTDNFIFMRGASLTGAKWLDDQSWQKIVINLRRVSRAVRLSKAKGIGFDPEYYYSDPDKNPWLYKPSLYDGLSYEEVGSFVKKRGRQFMEALQADKPDIKILCFWLLGLVRMQQKTQPIAETGMALYPFFVEGMLEAHNQGSSIIDGNEYSYGIKDPAAFPETIAENREAAKTLLSAAGASQLQKQPAAQAIFFDLIFAKNPDYEKGLTYEAKARWLRQNLYAALKSTDKYVWFYNQKVNWWKGEIDSGVANIIQNVKKQVRSEWDHTPANRKGSLNSYDSDASSIQSFPAVSYSYQASSRRLGISDRDTLITSVRIFENSNLIYETNRSGPVYSINLKGLYSGKGNLIIIARTGKGKLLSAFVN